MLRRIISPVYRRAVAAEAEGSYLLAARFYALCGLDHKVAEMHLLEATRPGPTGARLEELRAATRWLGPADEQNKALRRRIGSAFREVLKQGVRTQAERAACREAAQLSLGAGDALGAAEAFELCGDLIEAAEAYRDAGEIERMEALLSRDEEARVRRENERRHFEDYEMYLSLGRRSEALAALTRCAEAAVARAEPRRLLDELSARLLRGGRVTLRVTAPGRDKDREDSCTFIGEMPVLIGRGGECAVVLRDAGVSRCHARVRVGPEVPGQLPTFLLCDLESRNGTTLGGLALGGELPLSGQGEIGIGDRCVIGFSVEGACLRLHIRRGLERGRRYLASPRPMAIVGDDGVSAALSFDRGVPCLFAASGLVLNGRRCRDAVQLIIGDRIEVGESRYEVVG